MFLYDFLHAKQNRFSCVSSRKQYDFTDNLSLQMAQADFCLARNQIDYEPYIAFNLKERRNRIYFLVLHQSIGAGKKLTSTI